MNGNNLSKVLTYMLSPLCQLVGACLDFCSRLRFALKCADQILSCMVSLSLVVTVEEMEEGDSPMILPLDDIAWADSCLIGGVDIENSDWSSMKNTLLEILGSEPDLFVSAAASSTDIEILPSAEEPDSPPSFEASDDESDSTDEVEIEQLLEKYGNLSIKKGTSVFKLGTPSGDRALRSHFDYMKGSGDIYQDLEFKFSEVNLEDSSRDIFKVWEFDFPNQEQELVTQLWKAVGEDSFKPPGSFEQVIKDFDKDEMLDDLVAGVADISLYKDSP
ncbi:hypothetical protein RJ641_013890 [Dillenia turbinata]|uniref:Uncharacterized protein n=1 Tax=Dillenia turbinata TaxID=194707 RepID=A0AAN8ZTJ9_9MAGN